MQLFLRNGYTGHGVAGKGGVVVGVAQADAVDHVHAAGHLAEDGVAAVQDRSGGKGDEELAAVGSSAAGIGHGHHPGLVEGQVAVLVDKLV